MRCRAPTRRFVQTTAFGHVGYVLLNLISNLDVVGVALNTVPVSFIFGFGTSLPGEHPLDFPGVRHVHSVAAGSACRRMRRRPAPARSRHLCRVPARAGGARRGRRTVHSM